MKRIFKLTISKKIFLLATILSLTLIIVSVLVASIIFNFSIKRDAKTICSNYAKLLSEYISDYDFVINGAGARTNFITHYQAKLDEVYKENYETIEKMSFMDISTQEKLDEKKQYFNQLVGNIFGEGFGFGMSLEKLYLKQTYVDIVDEMQRMIAVDGMFNCEIFYYDIEHNRMVYMFDAQSEKSSDFSYPCSVEIPSKNVTTVINDNSIDAFVFSENGYFVSYAPILVNDRIIAYSVFEYSIDTLIGNEKEFIWMLLSVMLVAMVLILFAYVFLTKRWVIKNVTKLSETARTFTLNMDEGVIQPIDAEIKTNDELKDLSDDFFSLQNKVVEYSNDIARKTAIEEHMKAELNIASKIQMQSLPNKPLSHGDIFISSFIQPAKEVGGDLFDYFVIEDGKIFFVIADVSGKGVPAALFMMRGKEIIKSCAKAGMSASKIAETANEELCTNNKECLFITAFIGIYDEKQRLLSFVRAGQEQPFLLRNNIAERIGEESNYVLGAYKNISFIEDSLIINPGDKLLFYTDGLNEGINEKDEEFGYDRIKEILEHANGDILGSLCDKSFEFAGPTEQFDDLTMLLFECVKNETITISSPTYDDIETVTDKINKLVEDLNKDKVSELDIILDELLNNYVSYSFENIKRPQIEIQIKLYEGVITLTFEDNGILFNPLLVKSPNVDVDFAERPIGGLGIMIVKNLSDDVYYSVYKGNNRLTITKDLK